jgi:thioredoxin 1
MVITLTDENFEAEVLNYDKPVLVDFWASWCGPCKMVSPVIDELANEYEGKIKVGKVNVDEYSSLAAKYQVMSIPTVFMFKDGEPAEKLVGARPKREYETVFAKYV